jgi:hypothetical protein
VAKKGVEAASCGVKRRGTVHFIRAKGISALYFSDFTTHNGSRIRQLTMDSKFESKHKMVG